MVNQLPCEVFIFIAAQFDEASVVSCVTQMRMKGLSVRLVGLHASMLIGMNDLVVQSDLSFSELIERISWYDGRYLFIIPGEYDCAATLLSDPRLHHLIETALERGYVAAMLPAQKVVVQSIKALAHKAASHFLTQDSTEMPDFVQRLIDVCLQPEPV